MKGTSRHPVFIAAVTISLLLPVALAQSNTSKKSNVSAAAPPLPPPPLYSLTEAPADYTLKQLEFFELYCFTEVNKQRVAQHLEPLIFLAALLPIARSFSRQQAEENFFSHHDPLGRTLTDRLRQRGVKGVTMGENLSQASGLLDPVPDVVANWMRNPGHRTNILDPRFKYAAIGVWIKDRTFFFTEIFVDK